MARRQSVRAWLIALVLLSVLPITLLIAGKLLSDRAVAVELRRQALEQVAVAVASQYDLLVRETATVLAVLAASLPDYRTDLLGCRRVAAQTRVADGNLLDVIVTDLYGQVQCSGRPQSLRLNVKNRPFFAQALGRNGLIIGATVVTRGDRVPVLPLATPLRASDGKLIGVVAVALPLAVLNDLAARLNIPEHARLQVLGGSGGELLAERPGRGPGLDGPGWRDLTSGLGPSQLLELPDGEAAVALAADGAVQVAVTMARADVTAALDRELRNRLLAALGAIGAAVLMAVLVARQAFIRPLEDLARAAHQLRHGGFEVRAATGAWVAELDGLARSMNGMAQQLGQRHAAVLATGEELKRLAESDTLTGLPNRLAFDRALGQAVAQGQRGACALVMIDVDHFKQVNDRYGHPAGDALLRIVAHRLQACVRTSDVVARIAGDEFAILLGDVDADPATPAAIAERVVCEVASPALVNGVTLTPKVSVGFAFYPEDAADGPELVAAADAALYAAKRSGRGTSVRFDPAARGAAAPAIAVAA